MLATYRLHQLGLMTMLGGALYLLVAPLISITSGQNFHWMIHALHLLPMLLLWVRVAAFVGGLQWLTLGGVESPTNRPAYLCWAVGSVLFGITGIRAYLLPRGGAWLVMIGCGCTFWVGSLFVPSPPLTMRIASWVT